MKISFLVITLGIVLSLGASSQKPGTKLTYYIEHEVERNQDYIELILKVSAADSSLTEALADAESNVKHMIKLVKEYCEKYHKKKDECSDFAESGKFNVEPRYQLIRKEPVFREFVVSYEVTAKILHPDEIGTLIDQINKKSNIQINNLQWKSFSETDDQLAAISEGIAKGEKKCKNLGLLMGDIHYIEEVVEFQLQEEEGQEDEQQQEEDQNQVVVYKFTVECIPKKK